MITMRPAMTYEERQRFNGKLTVLPLVGLTSVAIYALVRGPQRLLLPHALVDWLYPYALLPWEQSFAEGLSPFNQQFVVLGLIGAIVQVVIGLPVILSYMPEMKALPDIRKSIVLAPVMLSGCFIGRLLFIGEANNVLHNSGLDVGRQLAHPLSSMLICVATFLIVIFLYLLIICVKIYNYND